MTHYIAAANLRRCPPPLPIPRATCTIYLQSTLTMLSGGTIGSCEELVGGLAADGLDCSADIADYFAGGMMPPGVTVKSVCCKTCSKGAGADPITGECQKVHDQCVMDMQGMMSCDACDDPTTADEVNQCTACVKKAFGSSYKACSCCMLPIFEEMMGGHPDESTMSVMNMIFPCDV